MMTTNSEMRSENNLPLEGGGRAAGRAGGGVSSTTKPFTPTTQKQAVRLRNNMTDAEKKLWYRLRSTQLGVKFRRQQPIGPCIADFVCMSHRLIIEVDGAQHADSDRDQARDQFLKNEGYTVLRFWNHEVLTAIDAVLTAIMNHPLLTSPLKGEGFPSSEAA